MGIKLIFFLKKFFFVHAHARSAMRYYSVRTVAVHGYAAQAPAAHPQAVHVIHPQIIHTRAMHSTFSDKINSYMPIVAVVTRNQTGFHGLATCQYLI
jgi:hypothetical protein